MIFFWFFYYLILIFICFSLSKVIQNKFINYFLIPIIFGIFGSVWYLEPGKNEIAPIVSILFLELSILESNGINRLLRPIISFILLLELISLVSYFLQKSFSKI
tara:strand:+ start:20674 stop:20985 length:312 start_codon:yes stop_codon:yes gene_type:complete